jgi:hypothetical protein
MLELYCKVHVCAISTANFLVDRSFEVSDPSTLRILCHHSSSEVLPTITGWNECHPHSSVPTNLQGIMQRESPLFGDRESSRLTNDVSLDGLSWEEDHETLVASSTLYPSMRKSKSVDFGKLSRLTHFQKKCDGSTYNPAVAVAVASKLGHETGLGRFSTWYVSSLVLLHFVRWWGWLAAPNAKVDHGLRTWFAMMMGGVANFRIIGLLNGLCAPK